MGIRMNILFLVTAITAKTLTTLETGQELVDYVNFMRWCHHHNRTACDERSQHQVKRTRLESQKRDKRERGDLSEETGRSRRSPDYPYGQVEQQGGFHSPGPCQSSFVTSIIPTLSMSDAVTAHASQSITTGVTNSAVTITTSASYWFCLFSYTFASSNRLNQHSTMR